MIKKVLFCFLLYLLSFLHIPLSYAKTVTLATTVWAPYVREGVYKGYAYEIVIAAFKQAGYDVRVVFMPWDNAVRAVNDGQVDGLFPEYFSKRRLKTIIFTEPFSGGPLGLFKKVNSGIHFPVSNPNRDQKLTFDEMKKYRFGVVRDYINTEAFDNAHNLKKVYAASDEENLRNLYEGKVDLVFIDKYTAEYLLYHVLPVEYREQMVFMQPPLGYKKLYVGISKKVSNANQLVKDFNKGLSEIKKTGILNKIIDRDAQFEDDRVG